MVQADLTLPVPVEWKEVGTVEKLTIFPVKSCMGKVVHEAQATKEGLRGKGEVGSCLVDRHFMVADAKNKLVSARKYAQMVLIEPELVRDAEQRDVLTLKAPGMDEMMVRLPRKEDMKGMQEETLEIHGWHATGMNLGQEVSEWISKFIMDREDGGLKLLWHGHKEETTRPDCELPLTPFRKEPDDRPYYADCFPFLLLSDKSVDELNRRLEESETGVQVSDTWFRPNISVKDVSGPFVEDEWTYVKIGEGAVFRVNKLCGRCEYTNVDPETGTKIPRGEVLKALRMFRRTTDPDEYKLDKSPFFGVNLGLEKAGVIKSGDKVFVGRC